MVAALPLRCIDKINREIDDKTAIEVLRRQAHAVPAEGQWCRRSVLEALPTVKSQMQDKWRRHVDQDIAAGGHDIEGQVGPPVPRVVLCLLEAEILLHRGQQLERALALPGDQQLQEFGMRPDQRHGAAGGLAGFQPARRYRWPVPDLFGNESPRPSHARHRREIRQGILPEHQVEMAALAGQQWPGTAYADAVERAAVLVLAIAVAVIAAIGGAQRRLHLEQSLGDLERVLVLGSLASRNPRRTR